MNFFTENLQVFKKVFLPLFALVVLSTCTEQVLNLYLEKALRDYQGAQDKVYILGFLSIVSSIIFPVLLSSIALYALNRQIGWQKPLKDFWAKNLNQLYIETLRSWGKTLLWSLLFLLPGIWKYFLYTLVPVIVTSSLEYEDGKKDALQFSSQIVRRNFFKVLGAILLFQIFIPLVMATLFNAYRLLWETPLQSLLLSVFDTYLLIIFTQILFNIFISEVRKHEAHV